MGLVNLKEMSKKLKMTEDEVEEMVEMGIIKPPAYCYPAKFGDGHSIAFRPEQVEEQVKVAKSKPKPQPEPEPEEPEGDEETAEALVPEEPKDDQGEGEPKPKEKKKDKKK
jgi:hypothetical protein